MQLSFENFRLADEPFGKSLKSFEFCVLINNNLCRKLVPSLEPPRTFDKRFEVISLPSFIPDFNLLICKLDKFTFQILYCVILY